MLSHLHLRFFVDANSLGQEEPVSRYLLQVVQEVSRRERAHQVDQGYLAQQFKNDAVVSSIWIIKLEVVQHLH
jgi:hypothetical protein